MFISFKKKISNNIHENITSHFINFKNIKVKLSYKKIFDEAKNNPLKYRKCLIDGSFYNLGYFYRLQIFRAAIKNKKLEEHAYIWNFNKTICRNILNSLGIHSITDMSQYKNVNLIAEAENICNNIKHPSDIINYKYPEEIPGLYLYDVILKKQRNKTVNIKDKNLKWYIFEYLSAIEMSKKLLLKFKPDIVALSHRVSFQCAPMAYLASKNGIETYILSGNFGVPRFTRIKEPNDIFFGIPHPPKKDIELLEKNKVNAFKKIGSEYLEQRKLGRFSDLSSRLAFGKGRNKFDLTDSKYKQKKIISIYVGNWFDFPHVFGMKRFLDVFDWITTTIKFASQNKEVIWLIKPHPAEKWYGGTTLEDSLPDDLPENIVILPNDYDGKAIMQVSDALVTIHGTSGIEYASEGKPVLVADVGWYHNCDFVLFPRSREHYLQLLKTKWYEKTNSEKIKAKAELFAGLRFGIPYWQKDALLPDDSDREILREFLPKFIISNKITIKKEINLLKKWLKSDKIDYHTYKVTNSVKNIVQGSFKPISK